MSEEFVKIFDSIGKSPELVDRELKLCVGKVYKYINDENITFYIEVEYYRGFDKIGINHHSSGESVFDEWDVEHFYEIIKDSVEIDNKE